MTDTDSTAQLIDDINIYKAAQKKEFPEVERVFFEPDLSELFCLIERCSALFLFNKKTCQAVTPGRRLKKN